MGVVNALSEAFASQLETSLRDDELPRSQEESERIRDEVAKKIGPIKAWKLGATITAVRSQLGLVRPFFGPIPASCVFEDGAELQGFHTRLQGVESEYGFELARDVEPHDAESSDEVFRRLFSCIRPTIEIPGTRYSELGRYGGFGLVADFGAAGGLVLGAGRPIEDWHGIDKVPVRLFCGRRQVAVGSAEVIDGGATGPLRAFLRQAAAAGYALQAGQTIVTGSCTGYVKAPSNEFVRATFDALNASVRVTFKS